MIEHVRFHDVHALVTGAASGIGRATALRLAAEGAIVTVADINEVAAKEVADLTNGSAVTMDVTDAEAVRIGCAAAEDVAGPVSTLVCCAGGDRPSFFVDTDEDDWDRGLAVNLRGALACTHAVLPGMLRRRHGSIVLVASEAGRTGMVGGAVYAAAKAGVIGFAKAIACEAAPVGVRCNTVAPGPIDTPMLAELAASGPLGARLRQGMVDATVLNRAGTPDEVAAAIAFLASDDASYITGHTIPVSGGISMW